MFDWLESFTALQKLIGVPSLVALIGLTWRYVVNPSWSFVGRLNAGMVKLEDFEPIEFKACVGDVATIKKAIGPNGGRNLYDRVEVACRAARLSEARMSTMLDVVVDRPMFQANAAGDFTWCNRALETMFETSCDDVAGRGWINLVLPEDRDRVVRDVRHAVSDKRNFQTIARFVSQRAGIAIMAKFSAQPIIDEADPDEVVIAWMGTIEPASGRGPA